MNKSATLSTGRAAGAILLAVAVLIAAQMLSQLLAGLLAAWGCPAFLCNALAGVLYPVLTLTGLLPVCRKVLRASPAQCRLPAFSLSPVWIICAVLMPAAVCGGFLLLPGRWEAASVPDVPALICAAVFYLGLGTGVVEEAVFRGVLLTAVERRWNRLAAVLVPSAAFAALHLAGSPLDVLSALQLLAAGTAVGVLFSLVTLASGGIWASAMMHGLWNIVMIGGIVHIGPSADPSSIFSYVTDTHSRLLTGGEFGAEASLFATAAYVLSCSPLCGGCPVKNARSHPNDRILSAPPLLRRTAGGSPPVQPHAQAKKQAESHTAFRLFLFIGIAAPGSEPSSPAGDTGSAPAF